MLLKKRGVTDLFLEIKKKRVRESVEIVHGLVVEQNFG